MWNMLTRAEAQNNTQIYGRRPYGVGFLVIGEDVGNILLAHG